MKWNTPAPNLVISEPDDVEHVLLVDGYNQLVAECPAVGHYTVWRHETGRKTVSLRHVVDVWVLVDE